MNKNINSRNETPFNLLLRTEEDDVSSIPTTTNHRHHSAGGGGNIVVPRFDDTGVQSLATLSCSSSSTSSGGSSSASSSSASSDSGNSSSTTPPLQSSSQNCSPLCGGGSGGGGGSSLQHPHQQLTTTHPMQQNNSQLAMPLPSRFASFNGFSSPSTAGIPLLIQQQQLPTSAMGHFNQNINIQNPIIQQHIASFSGASNGMGVGGEVPTPLIPRNEPLSFGVERFEPPQKQLERKIVVTLANADLWKQFNHRRLYNEMIVTRPGRKMFPKIDVNIKGLDPEQFYSLSLHMELIDEYRWKFQSGIWTKAGQDDAAKLSNRIIHHDGPYTKGEFWMKETVSFDRVKLTNRAIGTGSASGCQISLASMHKYHPVVTVCKLNGPKQPPELSDFSFPECRFIAVTAYQNEEITKLKIAHNPFAKGFREGSSRKRSLSISPNPSNSLQICQPPPFKIPAVPTAAGYPFVGYPYPFYPAAATAAVAFSQLPAASSHQPPQQWPLSSSSQTIEGMTQQQGTQQSNNPFSTVFEQFYRQQMALKQQQHNSNQQNGLSQQNQNFHEDNGCSPPKQEPRKERDKTGKNDGYVSGADGVQQNTAGTQQQQGNNSSTLDSSTSSLLKTNDFADDFDKPQQNLGTATVTMNPYQTAAQQFLQQSQQINNPLASAAALYNYPYFAPYLYNQMFQQ